RGAERPGMGPRHLRVADDAFGAGPGGAGAGDPGLAGPRGDRSRGRGEQDRDSPADGPGAGQEQAEPQGSRRAGLSPARVEPTHRDPEGPVVPGGRGAWTGPPHPTVLASREASRTMAEAPDVWRQTQRPESVWVWGIPLARLTLAEVVTTIGELIAA